ncbi:hypothetical protein A1351_09075 [Methylosinus sp. R-45379]|uniref:hypothetical protein n=1 Tax=unclassified Methylosinus TaxID=2624500 RepID=UPI000462FE4C|nr:MULTISPECIES: hypothetical protein [unclassified Methylosinus]OAI30517.1 hypothetical protein A1351_09075 [Methylosinus sp. R-45379]TDX63365.1 hypothetical protein EDE12_1072 [Methylosinus sp. sav-2]
MATTRGFFHACLLMATLHGACAQEIARTDQEDSRADDDTRAQWLRQIDEARERYDSFASRVVADLDRIAEARAEREDARLDDPTLRRGDILVTATGLLMFKGSRKFFPDLSDFEPIGEARARRSDHAATLLDILRAHARAGRRGG